MESDQRMARSRATLTRTGATPEQHVRFSCEPQQHGKRKVAVIPVTNANEQCGRLRSRLIVYVVPGFPYSTPSCLRWPRRAVLRIAGPTGELAPHTAMRYDMQDRHPQPWAYPGPYGRGRLHAWGYRSGLQSSLSTRYVDDAAPRTLGFAKVPPQV